MSFDKKNTTKKSLPTFKWESLKDSILGKNYDLSLIFCGRSKSKKLNTLYRGKNYSTNILSFPVSETMGEIFIDLDTVASESKSNLQPFNDRLIYIYIHGLLHLSGLDHGKKMEDLEDKYIKKLKLKI